MMKSDSSFVPVIGFVITLLLFPSCLSGEAQLSLGDSGTLSGTLTYRVNRIFAGLGLVGESRLLLPLPTSQREVDAAQQQYPGLTFSDVEFSDETEYINAQCRFRVSEESAAEFWLTPTSSFRVLSDEKRLEWLLWNPFSGNEFPDETKALLDSLSESMDWVITLELPGTIRSNNLGIVQRDRRTIILELDYREIIDTNESVQWSVQWN